ncbi:MAG: hypothetical protein LBT56_00485 [Prevotellaceae bacterium]|jgi:hypothetical protein|nr:hypothetical protein [Prevotellaceae bacterium]
MTFEMQYKIMIGEYRVVALDSVTIKKSVENLADTATIVIPGTYINKSLQVEDKISEGDAVEIYLGYDDNILLEFKGYVNAISTDDSAIKIECEDALYLFRKSLKDVELKSISLKSLLTKVVGEVNQQNKENKTPTNYTVKCDYDFTWSKFVFFKATALDVLKKVQEETKANIYFKEDVLHIHPPYSEIINSKPVIFDFAANIEKSDLKYVKAKDKKIEVEVTVTLPNGDKKSQKFGQQGGTTIKKISGSTKEADMKRVAESEYNLWVYDGYEGNFTCWLIPYVEPTYKVHLQDSEYTNKNGNYYVVATETSFSSSGGIRKVTLGRKIG